MDSQRQLTPLQGTTHGGKAGGGEIVITKPSARPWLPCCLARSNPSSRYSRSLA